MKLLIKFLKCYEDIFIPLGFMLILVTVSLLATFVAGLVL